MTGSEFTDTAIMKTLDDMRNLLAQENTAMLPVPSENLPTYGNKSGRSAVIAFLEVLAAHRDIAVIAADLDL
jgi:hypothetical protein